MKEGGPPRAPVQVARRVPDACIQLTQPSFARHSLLAGSQLLSAHLSPKASFHNSGSIVIVPPRFIAAEKGDMAKARERYEETTLWRRNEGRRARTLAFWV